MESWIFFVFIAQLIWAACTVFDKFLISKGYIKSPLVYIFFNGLMNLLAFLMLPFIGFSFLTPLDMLIALSNGILLSIAVTLYYKAVSYDEISRIRMMELLAPPLIFLTAFVFLGETLSAVQVFGFLFFIASGVLVSYRRGKRGPFISKAFLIMSASAIAASFSFVGAKHIFNSYGFWNALFWLRLAQLTSTSVMFVPSIRQDFRTSMKSMGRIKWLLVVKMLIDFSAFIFGGLAVKYGPSALVAAANTSVAPIMTFLIATTVTLIAPKYLQESLDKRSILTKLAAIGLIIIGVLIINIG